MLHVRGLRLFIVALVAVALGPSAVAADERHTVVLTHDFDAMRSAQLGELVERFNAQDKRYRVDLQRVDAKAPAAPTLMVLEGDAEAALRGSRGYQPIYRMMAQSGINLARADRKTQAVGMTVDTRGRQLALPIGMHTPVMFYNRQAFREAGLDPADPPRTWKSLQAALGKLYAAGHACPSTVSRPSWVMLDNVSARQNESVTRSRGRNQELSVNGLLQIRHVAMMASWVRARYLHVFDDPADAEARFTRGECVVIASSSADWPAYQHNAAFEVGVAELPYHDDQGSGVGSTLADGASLWAAAGRSRNDYRAAASFVRFLLKPESQLAWQRGTGYLPLDAQGRVSASAVAADQPALMVARAQLHLTDRKVPWIGLAEMLRRARARAILDEELAAVWADLKPAKQALDTAVVRVSALR